MTPTKRSEAQRRGSRHYYTGKPCLRGHVSNRMTQNGKCLECHRLEQIGYRSRNPEKVRAMLASWYARNREHVAAYAKAWQEAHPEYSAIKSREWNLKNKEYCAERARIKNQTFPEKARVQRLRRRARLEDAGPRPSEDEIKALFAAQKGRCAYCKTNLRKLPLSECHLDHITPIAKGGTNALSNLQFCCKPCNLRKNKKDPIRFAQELGMLL